MSRRTRYYMIVRVNDKTGSRTDMLNTPVTHEKALVIKSKMMNLYHYSQLRNVLEERKPDTNTRKLASKFIAEEMRTHKYPRKQAIAIGLSRARQSSKGSPTAARLKSLLAKYK